MTPEALIIENLFRVVTKNGEDVDFILNSAQRALDNNLAHRNIIPKARQEGISTYFLARYTAACLAKRNVKAVIISHDAESTERLLTRCNYFLDNLKCQEKPLIGRTSLRTITFPKTNSMIYIGTAGAKKFGRGDTITHLHCSEYAYWSDPKGLLAGLLQAVPMDGEISIESTGNGKGNDYHRRCMRAYAGQSVWKCHFFNWINFTEYTLSLTPKEDLMILSKLSDAWGEPELVEKYGLTAGQIAWRRVKLEEMDYDIALFEQEYPITIEDCFKPSGASLFQSVNLVKTEDWKYQGNYVHKLENHPMPDKTYSIGVDPAGGVGGDNSVIEIICVETNEQVLEYAHNLIEPDALGDKVALLGEEYNNAFLTVESNNHGPVTIKALQDANYPEHLMYSMRTGGGEYGDDVTLMELGFRTTKRTKPIMIGDLRTALAANSDPLTIHSTLLSDELSTFIEHPNGSLAAQENCHDDRVIGIALANTGLTKAALYATLDKQAIQTDAAPNPFSLESIVDELQKGANKFPVSSQHRVLH